MTREMLCALCGSPDVTRDAWAEWDPEKQDWRLGALFATSYCHACLKETIIVERPGATVLPLTSSTRP